MSDPIIREGRELESRITSVTTELNLNGPSEAKKEAELAEDGPVSFKSAKQADAEKRETEETEAEEETSGETERRP